MLKLVCGIATGLLAGSMLLGLLWTQEATLLAARIPPSARLVRLGQLDPTQYQSAQEYRTWAMSACSAAAMTEVFNAYGRHYRITNVLQIEARLQQITPAQGLLRPGGIALTATAFGFQTQWSSHWPFSRLVATVSLGYPVIVDFPPDQFAGGHILVVIGATAERIFLADSSGRDMRIVSTQHFLHWWAGYGALIFPNGLTPPTQTHGELLSTDALIALARQEAQVAGIPADLFVRQIALESGFRPDAISPAGAVGIAQFLPSTAASLGIDPWNPREALRGAAELMARYTRDAHGDYRKALAAYNAGPGTLHRALTICGTRWQSCLPIETQHYLQRIVGS